MTFTEFRSIMESRGPVQRDGRDWRGRCPVCNDTGKRGNLAFREGDGGHILIHCWSGCKFDSIVAALGLKPDSLFPDNGNGCGTRRPESQPRAKTTYASPQVAGSAIAKRLGGQFTEHWLYKNQDGSESFTVLRFDNCDGDKPKSYRPLYRNGAGYVEGDPPKPLVLYRLPELVADVSGQVFVTEGEKAAEAARSIGLLATTSAHGADSPGKTDWRPLAGRDVAILPDNDNAGRHYADDVTAILLGLEPPAKVRVVTLPDLPPGGDIYDFTEERDDAQPAALRSQIIAMVERSKPEEKPTAARLQTDELGKSEKCPRGGDARLKPELYNLTDVGNAERFRDLYREKLRFCEQRGGWAYYDGCRWDFRTGRTRAAQLAVETVRHIARVEAMNPRLDKDDRKKLFAWALQSESSSKLASLLKCAETLPGLVTDPGDFDRDLYLFNCANGTTDLRTGVLRPHDSADMITAVAPVEYDPDNIDPEAQYLWDRHLDRVLGGDRELIAFLQRAVGYTLTGDTREESLFFVNGPTAGGKSTTIEALKATFGEDYTKTARFESFLKKTGDGGPSNDIARLAGARFVASVEVDDGKQLAEGLVKQLTGRDTVSARFLYREAFDFRPKFKLWLCANAAPRVSDSDAAMWRRILLVPFLHTIPQADRDPTIKDKLTDPRIGGPAILAWAVQGCLEWQQQGLRPPEVVLAKTSEYRANQDPLKDFFADECAFGAAYMISVSQLRQVYVEYAKENGIRFPLSPREFNDRLRGRGCKDDRHRFDGKLQRCWSGVTTRGGDPAGEAFL